VGEESKKGMDADDCTATCTGAHSPRTHQHKKQWSPVDALKNEHKGKRRLVVVLVDESRFGSRYDGGARVLLIAARVHIPTDLSGLLPTLATTNQQLICGVRQRK
jgi:hypothetical protein